MQMNYKAWKVGLMKMKKEEIIDELFRKIKHLNQEKSIIRATSEGRLIVTKLLRRRFMRIRDWIDYEIKHPYSKGFRGRG